MAEDKSFIVEVEKARDAKDGRPSMGPVYRSCFTEDVSPPSIQGLDTCWDVFRSLSFHSHIYFHRSQYYVHFYLSQHLKCLSIISSRVNLARFD